MQLVLMKSLPAASPTREDGSIFQEQKMKGHATLSFTGVKPATVGTYHRAVVS